MKNFKNKKINLMKIGKGAILFSSLALPISIISKKVDASPLRGKVNIPNYIATPNQMRNLLKDPYKGGPTDTPFYRYYSFLSGLRISLNKPNTGITKHSTTLTVKHSSTTGTGQSNVIIGKFKPTPVKFRSELKVRLQARPQTAIVTQQSTSNQGTIPKTHKPGKGSGGSSQQHKTSSSSSTQQSSKGTSSSSTQHSDGSSSKTPFDTGPIPTAKVSYTIKKQVSSSQAVIHTKNISKNLTQTTSSSTKKSDHKSDDTKPSPVSAKVTPLTKPQTQFAKSESQKLEKDQHSYVVIKSTNTPTNSDSRPSTPISSDDEGNSRNIRPDLEGKFVTNSDGSISLMVKSKSTKTIKQEDLKDFNVPPAPPNTPVPSEYLKFSRVQFLKNYFDGLLGQGGDSDKKTKPVTNINVQSLKKQFESSSNQNTTQTQTKPTPPSSNVTNLKKIFEKSSSTEGSKIIFPTNSGGSNNATLSSSNTSFNATSSTSTSTTTSTQPTKTNSVATQTDDITSSSGTTSQIVTPDDRNQQNTTPNIQMIKIKLNLEIDDPNDIEKIHVRTKIKFD